MQSCFSFGVGSAISFSLAQRIADSQARSSAVMKMHAALSTVLSLVSLPLLSGQNDGHIGYTAYQSGAITNAAPVNAPPVNIPSVNVPSVNIPSANIPAYGNYGHVGYNAHQYGGNTNAASVNVAPAYGNYGNIGYNAHQYGGNTNAASVNVAPAYGNYGNVGYNAYQYGKNTNAASANVAPAYGNYGNVGYNAYQYGQNTNMIPLNVAPITVAPENVTPGYGGYDNAGYNAYLYGKNAASAYGNYGNVGYNAYQYGKNTNTASANVAPAYGNYGHVGYNPYQHGATTNAASANVAPAYGNYGNVGYNAYQHGATTNAASANAAPMNVAPAYGNYGHVGYNAYQYGINTNATSASAASVNMTPELTSYLADGILGSALASRPILSFSISEPNRNETPQDGECRNNEFRCDSNECVPSSVKCDNKADCRDSSDEKYCLTNRNQENGCILPKQPENGRYMLRECNEPCTKSHGDTVQENSILSYSCKHNYFLRGNDISVCINNDWNTLPSCVKMCPPLRSTSVDISCSYQGETVSCSKRVVPNTRARLSCKLSYFLPLESDPGYKEITCLNDGSWDNHIFRCKAECGTSTPHGSLLIVNGLKAKIGVFPWHVGIYRKKQDITYEQICGGTMISNNLVISAAHCFYDEINNKLNNISNYAVAAGKHYRAWDVDEEYCQKKLMVESIGLRERYQGARNNYAQDIALVKLKTPFELTALVRPICIDWNNKFKEEQLREGQSGKVVGWGKNIDGEPTSSLYEIDMPYVPFHQCLSAVPRNFRGYLTSDKFCAGRLNGSSVCNGDSGDGLCFEKDGLWYLRGIVSVSPAKRDSCDYNSYAGFTGISHFMKWIREAYVKA